MRGAARNCRPADRPPIRHSRARWLLILWLVGSPACIDRYLVPEGMVPMVERWPDEVRARTALPAIREGDRTVTWVRADEVAVLPPTAESRAIRFDRVQERGNDRRVSPSGISLLVASTLGLMLAAIGAKAPGLCAMPGDPSCLLSSGDFILPVTLASGILFSLGAGLSIARAADHHPVEPEASAAGEMMFLGRPIHFHSAPSKTPLE